MRILRSTRGLSVAFLTGGLYDLVGAATYVFLVGGNRSIDEPATHPFYAIFIASFLLCFAYLQLLSSLNARRYMLVMGSVMIGRVFYAILLLTYLASDPGFPTTFLPTAILDLVWSVLYIALTFISDEVGLRDLFLPHLGDGVAA